MDNFFYNLNKKMSDLAQRQDLAESAVAERDMGKHNNATTGFKMMGPNLEIQFLQMSTKSCANVDVKLKYKGEVDKQLDDQYEH